MPVAIFAQGQGGRGRPGSTLNAIADWQRALVAVTQKANTPGQTAEPLKNGTFGSTLQSKFTFLQGKLTLNQSNSP